VNATTFKENKTILYLFAILLKMESETFWGTEGTNEWDQLGPS
jgi:hypothetical protein